jgi:hypothetical protein
MDNLGDLAGQGLLRNQSLGHPHLNLPKAKRAFYIAFPAPPLILKIKIAMVAVAGYSPVLVVMLGPGRIPV